MSLALSGKEVRDTHSTIYNLVKKIVKIGPVDPEIIGLQSKKKRNFRKQDIDPTVRSARMPSGLNNNCVQRYDSEQKSDTI